MEATLTRPAKGELKFTRKLTPEEIEKILEYWDYRPEYYNEEDDETVPSPVWDRFGNPTRETLDAMYEARHGLCEVVTVEEAIAEIHAACSGE